jgi:hypothetical protein
MEPPCQPTDEDAQRDRRAEDHRATNKRHRTESSDSTESPTASDIDAQMKFGAPTATTKATSVASETSFERIDMGNASSEHTVPLSTGV